MTRPMQCYCRKLGRYLMGSPYVATTLAAQALITSGSEAQKNQWLSEIASGAAASVGLTEEDGNWRLQEIAATATANGETLSLAGTKCFVLDAKQAQAIVVSVMFEGAARLVLIQADQVPSGALMREVVIDETRRSFTLSLTACRKPVWKEPLSALEQAAMLMLVADVWRLTVCCMRSLTTSQHTNSLIGTLAVANAQAPNRQIRCLWKPVDASFPETLLWHVIAAREAMRSQSEGRKRLHSQGLMQFMVVGFT